ncbi:hypothetical protein PFICI_04141 [Pestalotiopsis fici W106-1]|uniref:Uncharacterized protein n=1 Tax=Pestalotiopsis fici (strain W106-1 / CGMCC3.15140) TaxID=1229662 RepID=W3XLH7_PESFW|nr:uncharacterized protein PFICI_04141 [Pestalotiopsis fici W106-1]ETS86116.1 hypothetical protein PFICI_04141 [Pestalotiopsis fici W106-1]
MASLASRITNDFAPLNISALASVNGSSTIQCWQLAAVPVEARSALNFELGNTTEATWSIIQPQTVVGEAWAPAVQLTMVMNGMIHVSAPAAQHTGYSSTKEGSNVVGAVPPVQGYFVPGTLSSSVLIAADLKATSNIAGHFTEFPGNEPTVLVQIPFVNNEPPKHTVLYDGQCK